MCWNDFNFSFNFLSTNSFHVLGRSFCSRIFSLLAIFYDFEFQCKSARQINMNRHHSKALLSTANQFLLRISKNKEVFKRRAKASITKGTKWKAIKLCNFPSSIWIIKWTVCYFCFIFSQVNFILLFSWYSFHM